MPEQPGFFSFGRLCGAKTCDKSETSAEDHDSADSNVTRQQSLGQSGTEGEPTFVPVERGGGGGAAGPLVATRAAAGVAVGDGARRLRVGVLLLPRRQTRQLKETSSCHARTVLGFDLHCLTESGTPKQTLNMRRRSQYSPGGVGAGRRRGVCWAAARAAAARCPGSAPAPAAPPSTPAGAAGRPAHPPRPAPVDRNFVLSWCVVCRVNCKLILLNQANVRLRGKGNSSPVSAIRRQSDYEEPDPVRYSQRNQALTHRACALSTFGPQKRVSFVSEAAKG